MHCPKINLWAVATLERLCWAVGPPPPDGHFIGPAFSKVPRQYSGPPYLHIHFPTSPL